MDDALGGQAQELAATRQFQASLGPIEGWAAGVNTQLQGLNDAATGLQTAKTMDNKNIADLQGLWMEGTTDREDWQDR